MKYRKWWIIYSGQLTICKGLGFDKKWFCQVQCLIPSWGCKFDPLGSGKGPYWSLKQVIGLITAIFYKEKWGWERWSDIFAVERKKQIGARKLVRGKAEADECIRKLWYICTMEYYSAIKRNAFESVLMGWMNPEPFIRSEVSQKEKDKCCMLTHVYGI